MSKQPFLPNPSIPKDLLDHAFGPVKIGLTNDYLLNDNRIIHIEMQVDEQSFYPASISASSISTSFPSIRNFIPPPQR